MKPLHLWVLAYVFVGCLFDNSAQVAGAEDFPNTIAPLGKVAADNISAHANWDQFQSIDTTPDLSADSVALSVTAAKTAAAKLAVIVVTAVQETTFTVKKFAGDISIIQHVQVNAGLDGKLYAPNAGDNRIREYDVLRARSGDTLEWTQLLSGDGTDFLWGSGDSGIVVLNRQIKTPLARPEVLRLRATLKARIRNRGKNSTLLSYTEHCVLRNGDTTVFTVRGIRGDSSLVSNDTSLITYVQTSSSENSPSHLKGRYWIKLGKLARPYSDNALLRFDIVNQWQSGIIRYDSIAFTPDSAVFSGHTNNLHGSFVVSATDQTGAKSDMKGVFRNDSIQINMHETREGKSRNYHMVYDNHGDVQAKDTLPDNDFDDLMHPRLFYNRVFSDSLKFSRQ